MKGSANVFHKLMKYLREQVLIVPSIKYSIKIFNFKQNFSRKKNSLKG